MICLRKGIVNRFTWNSSCGTTLSFTLSHVSLFSTRHEPRESLKNWSSYAMTWNPCTTCEESTERVHKPYSPFRFNDHLRQPNLTTSPHLWRLFAASGTTVHQRPTWVLVTSLKSYTTRASLVGFCCFIVCPSHCTLCSFYSFYFFIFTSIALESCRFPLLLIFMEFVNVSLDNWPVFFEALFILLADSTDLLTLRRTCVAFWY